MSTTHNPVNFNPADYDVVDYIDNKRPVFLGLYAENFAAALAAYEAEVKAWEADNARLFGADWRGKIHHCIHCGNGNVRWITAVRHAPSGETVVFGSDCTERLGFSNKVAFKLALLQRRADTMAAALKAHARVAAFVALHPEIGAAYEAVKLPVHVKNSFVKDVLRKLAQYGSLSDRQIEAVTQSLAKDVEIANRPAEVKVAAPEGKVTLRGTVVATKWYENEFGSTKKATIKVETQDGIWLAWGTVPADILDVERGAVVELTATLTRGEKDPSFAFYKRPRAARVVQAA